MAQSNTFGTFLDTFRQLESSSSQGTPDGWEKDVLRILKVLGSAPQPLRQVIAATGVPEEAFLRAIAAGSDRKLLTIEETQGVPMLHPTPLGRAFAG